jgi:CRISPR-associated protein Cmr1
MNVTKQLKALTNIWTGDVECKHGKLKMTGIKGSIRWWYEALLRGLDIYACDGGKGCKFNAESFQKRKNLNAELQEICPACELFGCTGWSAKFNLRITDRRRNGTAVRGDSQIKKGETFILEFVERKEMSTIEKDLLAATMHLIVEYGAIGGKTVYKPSDENDRKDQQHHKDLGLIAYCNHANNKQVKLLTVKPASLAMSMNGYEWASLNNMWFVDGKYLTRQDMNNSSFNKIIGRPEPKNKSKNGDSWIAGSQGVSKKVFSFKSPARTFGFVEKSDSASFDAIKTALQGVWGANGWSFIEGTDILNKLFDNTLRTDGGGK